MPFNMNQCCSNINFFSCLFSTNGFLSWLFSKMHGMSARLHLVWVIIVLFSVYTGWGRPYQLPVLRDESKLTRFDTVHPTAIPLYWSSCSCHTFWSSLFGDWGVLLKFHHSLCNTVFLRSLYPHNLYFSTVLWSFEHLMV